MATAAKCICRQVRQVSHRTQCLSYRQSRHSYQHTLRPFSSTSYRLADNEGSSSSTTTTTSESSDSAPYFNRPFFNGLDRDDQATYRGLTPSERQQMETVSQTLHDEMSNDAKMHRSLLRYADSQADEIDDEFPEGPQEREPRNDGFFQMGEREQMGPDDDFQEDDITATAHNELEQQREIREYARLAAWEMPLLANLAIPFQPPTAATPLRFRHTTYMGEQHPASRKIVVEFCPTDLGLTTPQANKLIKLAGARYNPTTQIVRMSCESFETPAQNKRYLGDTVQKLMREAKDTAETFDDLPFDFRHVKEKRRHRFPEAWLLTEERMAELEERRRVKTADEAARETAAKLISGIRAIEEDRRINLARVEAPVMAEAKTPLSKGKQGKAQRK